MKFERADVPATRQKPGAETILRPGVNCWRVSTAGRIARTAARADRRLGLVPVLEELVGAMAKPSGK